MLETAERPGPRTPAMDDSAPGPLSSRYVDVDALSWVKSSYEGIDIKILFKDEERGLMTALFRWQPGARLPLHEHTDIEQTYVLEGSLSDHEGTCGPGQYVWRPAGSMHEAWTDDGCLVLATFLSPNRFFEGPDAG